MSAFLSALLTAGLAFDPASSWFDRVDVLTCPAAQGGFRTADRVALALVAARYEPMGSAAHGAKRVTRGRVVVVDRRTFAGVDLLDAGAGARLDGVGERITRADFRVRTNGITLPWQDDSGGRRISFGRLYSPLTDEASS